MTPRVRRVDPHAHRGRLYRAYARVSGTSRAALWLSRHVAWKVDPLLLRMSGGRLSLTLPIRTGVLETRGARTGAVRRNAVIYFHDGERVTLIASHAGAPTHPSWFHNLRANPDVLFGGQEFRAEVVEDEPSRQRLWALADQVFPPFAIYREQAGRTGRTIPLVQLVARSTPV